MERTRRKPPRVAARPDPAEWDRDELMTLPEAAALHWPDGPLTTHSLRVAVRDGALAVAVVAGRYLTSRRAIAEMGACRPLGRAPAGREADEHKGGAGAPPTRNPGGRKAPGARPGAIRDI